MYYATDMLENFEAQKNQRAFLYTAAIVVAMLLIAIFWTWPILPPPTPVAQDLIEINLGNLNEGFGEVQPLIKGAKSPGNDVAEVQQKASASSNIAPKDEVQPDETADADAAPVEKPNKPNPKIIKTPTPPTSQPVRTTTPAPVVAPAPKPRVPKIAGYNGPKGGTGNGADQDNGYRYQGNKPGGRGDAGSPGGNPDSYGNNPGGRTGGSGLRVSKGDRTIINNYIFSGDLPKATINAIIRVSPDGRGTFVGFDKGSTSSDGGYASAIRGYLPNIKFNVSDHESVVTVPFNFRVQN